jgi:hypothetical protein
MLSATTGFVAIAGGVGLAYEVPALVSAAGPAVPAIQQAANGAENGAGGPSIEAGVFAQTTARWAFGGQGSLAGRTIGQVADALRAGTTAVKDVKVQVIVRDGNTFILNTRSALALESAGIPRSAWNIVDMTGVLRAEKALTTQLTLSGLAGIGSQTVQVSMPWAKFP